ncbi:MAG TPA: hypothetical protein VGJ21_03690 [Terracidiphilus sp.]|jgi:hypothetical protein
MNAETARDIVANEHAPVGRTYRMSWWFRGFALFFLLFGGTFLFGILRGILAGETARSTVDIIVSVVFPIIGAGMSMKAFSAKITFSQGAITHSSFWNSRTVPLSAIAGRREYVVRGDGEGGDTRYLRLVFHDGSPYMDFGKNLYRFDAAFWNWFNQIPDLDARTHKDSNFGLV